MKSIAIIGAGFAGVACAWFLSQHANVVLFDNKGIGGAASGIAAGLLHPFVGQHCKLNRYGWEGLTATLSLLSVAEKALGEPVAEHSGMVRTAFTMEQQQNYRLASQQYSQHIDELSLQELSKLIDGVPNTPAIFIKPAYTVYTDKYLKGLWLACQQQGVAFEQKHVTTLNQLATFDTVILAVGGDYKNWQELNHLPFRSIKGQVLELSWPQNLPSLTTALNSQIYCVMSADKQKALAGATYERQFKTDQPDLAVASSEILPKLGMMYPPLQNAEVITCRAGIRVTTPDRMPCIQQINGRCWAFSGLSSRGLLYHALFAEKLAHDLFKCLDIV